MMENYLAIILEIIGKEIKDRDMQISFLNMRIEELEKQIKKDF